MENNSLICVYEKSLLRKLLLLCTKKKRNKSRRCQSAKAMGSYHFSPLLFSVAFSFLHVARQGVRANSCWPVVLLLLLVFSGVVILYQAVSILFV